MITNESVSFLFSLFDILQLLPPAVYFFQILLLNIEINECEISNITIDAHCPVFFKLELVKYIALSFSKWECGMASQIVFFIYLSQ